MKKEFFIIYDFNGTGNRKNHEMCFFIDGEQVKWERQLSFESVKELRDFFIDEGWTYLEDRDMRVSLEYGEKKYVPMERYLKDYYLSDIFQDVA